MTTDPYTAAAISNLLEHAVYRSLPRMNQDGVFQKERIIVVKPGDTIELKKDMRFK